MVCKLDIFTALRQLLLVLVAYKKSVSEFMPKKFYEIDPWDPALKY